MDAHSEYHRLKRYIHNCPLLDDKLLQDEIENYGKQFPDNKKQYNSLKKKYRWHRVYHPQHFPIGQAPAEWSNQQTPLVTVIVPNYCHSLYLPERIDCILNQTFQNFELILMDDCSTDNSRDILLSYKDHPRVSHVILNEQNTGNTFLQWEKGVGLARGKYIWIAESDDYADETFLDCCMAMFCLHEDCVLVRTGSYQVNEKDRVLTRDWDVWKEDETVHYYQGDDYIRHNMLHFNYIYNASMVVFRKDVFQQIDKSYQQMRFTGDWLCWVEMLRHGPICEYRRKLNYFRQHQNKVSARSNKTSKGMIDQVNVLSHILRHVPLSPLRKLLIRGEEYKLSLGWFHEDSDPAVREECFAALRDNLAATRKHYRWYKFLSLFNFLPFFPSSKNDKYK